METTTVTIATLLTDAGTVFTNAIDWVGDVVTTHYRLSRPAAVLRCRSSVRYWRRHVQASAALPRLIDPITQNKRKENEL